MKRKTDKKRWGFTLVELLTTLAVIGVLLGLLIPALNEVTKKATQVKQKAQFHAIGNALEAFRNDYGDYPPSAWSGAVVDISTASHNLAEALIGRDGFGFHPSSIFRGDGTINGDLATALYAPDVDLSANPDSLKLRKGPYLELENANAVRVGNIPVGSVNLDQEGYVLVDMYKQIKNTATGKEVGMPILYYNANGLKIGNVPDPRIEWGNNTYNFEDSLCGDKGFVTDPSLGNAFYAQIQNPNFPGPPARPYRAESFILQSAGPDGLYGTMDDIFNFDQNN
ncbi:MAG: type II secretion system protein [Planctomycetota bacterium]|jgi:prepilin-type N-terminal cleavage/methylation domain-containing protein